MKTENEVKERLEWAIKALDDEDNASELDQIKLWQWIDALSWVIEVRK